MPPILAAFAGARRRRRRRRRFGPRAPLDELPESRHTAELDGSTGQVVQTTEPDPIVEPAAISAGGSIKSQARRIAGGPSLLS